MPPAREGRGSAPPRSPAVMRCLTRPKAAGPTCHGLKPSNCEPRETFSLFKAMASGVRHSVRTLTEEAESGSAGSPHPGEQAPVFRASRSGASTGHGPGPQKARLTSRLCSALSWAALPRRGFLLCGIQHTLQGVGPSVGLTQQGLVLSPGCSALNHDLASVTPRGLWPWWP